MEEEWYGNPTHPYFRFTASQKPISRRTADAGIYSQSTGATLDRTAYVRSDPDRPPCLNALSGNRRPQGEGPGHVLTLRNPASPLRKDHAKKREPAGGRGQCAPPVHFGELIHKNRKTLWQMAKQESAGRSAPAGASPCYACSEGTRWLSIQFV